MSDRTEEVTDAAESDATGPGTDATASLLEETERLLGDEGGAAGRAATDDGAARERGASGSVDAETADAGTTSASGSSGRRLGSLAAYFSPKASLALAFALGAGVLFGAFLLPIGSVVLPALAITFAVGALTSRRRYAEVLAAGGTVGAVAAATNVSTPTLPFVGDGYAFAAAVAVAVLACLLGYYLGRDLRSGITRAVE